MNEIASKLDTIRHPAVLSAAIQCLHKSLQATPHKDVLVRLACYHLKNKSYDELCRCLDFLPNFDEDTSGDILEIVCDTEGSEDFLDYLDNRAPQDEKSTGVTGEERVQAAYVVGLLKYYDLIDDKKSRDFKYLFEKAAMPRMVDGCCVMHPGAMFMLGNLAYDKGCYERATFYFEYVLKQGVIKDPEAIKEIEELIEKYDWRKRSWLSRGH